MPAFKIEIEGVDQLNIKLSQLNLRDKLQNYKAVNTIYQKHKRVQ